MPHTVVTSSLALLRAAAAATRAHQLDAATACENWTVAQVLLHAAGDQHAWANAMAGSAPPTYNPFDPPRAHDSGVENAVAAAIDAATAAWASIEGPLVPTPLPPVPTLPLDVAARACALDAAVHAWDVAVATGQPSPLTPALAADLMPGAQATADFLRGFAYAPALPPHVDDDAVASLLRYLGRDPNWKAPA